MASSYQTIQLLIGERIISRPLELARSTCDQLDLQQPNANDDLMLLMRCREEEAGALLCLRCHVSHALADEARSLYNNFKRSNQFQSSQLELQDIAVFALHDEGKPHFYDTQTRRRGSQPLSFAHFAALADTAPTRILPLSMQVICTFRQDKQAGLTTWASRTLKSHRPLKVYLRDMHGILMISDWALLKDSSATRAAEAWDRHQTTPKFTDNITRQPLDTQAILRLLAAYWHHYKQDRTKHQQRHRRSGGYEPSDDFMRAIDPDADPGVTREWLRALAQAIRQFLSTARLTRQESEDNPIDQIADPRSYNPADADESDWTNQELMQMIESALQRAMDAYLPSVLVAAAADQLRSCLWRGFAQGLSNAPNAERCGTTRGTISKKLTPTLHAQAIALNAAEELKRHPAFAPRFQSLTELETLVQELTLYVLQPTQAQALPPLNRWVHHFFALLDSARQQALVQARPELLEALAQDPLGHRLWRAYAEGQSHAAPAKPGDGDTPAGTDTPERAAQKIAAAATAVVRQHPVLAALARTADGDRRLRQAMQSQLLQPECKGGVAPFHAWIQCHLPPLS